METRELGKARTNILLFMLSSIVFGIVLSFLAWSIPFFIPTWLSPSYVLAGAMILLFTLGWIAFRMLVPPLRFQDAVHCYFAYDMKKNEPLYSIKLNYGFWHVASMGFNELMKAMPEYKDALTRPIDPLNNDLFKQFMTFAMIHWLTLLPATVAFAAYRTKVPMPPRIYREPGQKMRTIHNAYYSANVTNVFLNLPSLIGPVMNHITVPRSMNLEVTEKGLTLKNRYLQISIEYQIVQWIRGVDMRIERLLELEKDKHEVASMSAIIAFDAKPGNLWWILPRSDRYWNFAKDMFENLRAQYDWSYTLDDVKESLEWESLSGPIGFTPTFA